MQEPTAQQGRRRSLFEQNGGNATYQDKLQEEVFQYIKERLDAGQQHISTSMENSATTTMVSEELLCIPFPDLNNYVEIIDEFSKKDTIVRQQRDQMTIQMEKMASKLL